MQKKLIFLLVCNYSNLALAEESNTCSKLPAWKWTQQFCKRIHQIWTKGENEFYLSGYAWHNRYTYSKEKIKTYNEKAWGGGLGKGFYDEKGNWHALGAIAFLDSHSKIEPAAGYTYLKVAHLNTNFNIGGGFSILATRRSDTFNGIPFVALGLNNLSQSINLYDLYSWRCWCWQCALYPRQVQLQFILILVIIPDFVG